MIERGEKVFKAIRVKAEAEGWQDPEGSWFALDADLTERGFHPVILGEHEMQEDGQRGSIKSHQELFSTHADFDLRGWNGLTNRCYEGQTTPKERAILESAPTRLKYGYDTHYGYGVDYMMLSGAGRYAATDRYVMFRGMNGRLKIAPNLQVTRDALTAAGFREDAEAFDGTFLPVIDDMHMPVDVTFNRHAGHKPVVYKTDAFYVETGKYWRQREDERVEAEAEAAEAAALEAAQYAAAEAAETPDVQAVAADGPNSTRLFDGNAPAEADHTQYMPAPTRIMPITGADHTKVMPAVAAASAGAAPIERPAGTDNSAAAARAANLASLALPRTIATIPETAPNINGQDELGGLSRAELALYITTVIEADLQRPGQPLHPTLGTARAHAVFEGGRRISAQETMKMPTPYTEADREYLKSTLRFEVDNNPPGSLEHTQATFALRCLGL